MPVDFSNTVYLMAQNTFGRPVTVYPLKSQPLVPSYVSRGIYNTVALDLQAEDGSIISDQKTILDIRDAEFAVMPLAGDRIDIAASMSLPSLGMFEVLDTDSNGGGETTVAIRKVVTAKP